jgi:capsular exopolysaccharide synthesis family protein
VELIDYIHILKRRWVLIAIVVIACVGGAAAATKLTTPQYQASSRLIVNGNSSLGGNDEIVTDQLAAARASSFALIISTGPAVQAALQVAEEKSGPFESSGSPSVSASADGTDPFITIDVTDTDPRRAQAVANAMAAVLPNVLKQLQQPPTTPHEIDLLQAASLPTKPASPKPKENLIIGLALGLVLGVAAAFVVETLDRRLKDSADVEAASGLTALGVVPFELPGEQIPAKTQPRSVRAEAYRQVRTNLAFSAEKGPPKSIIITSSASSEGKTSLAVNLAITSARTGQRVVLVDADLRRPMVHTFLDLPEHKGLVDVLAGTTELSDALQFSEAGPMDVLVAGPVPTNPSELLGSESMLKTIRQLESSYDFVVIDTPPVLPVTDALLIGVHVSAVVVVARLGQTTRDRIRRTTAALTHVNAHMAGVIPNGAIEREDSAYYYAYRYRSKRQAPDIPYRATEPVVSPDSNGLRPAVMANGKSHEPSSEPDGTLVESAVEPIGRHSPGYGRRATDTPAPPPQV